MKFLALLLSIAAPCLAADFVTGQAARLVIGQSSFTSQDPTVTASNLGGVGGIAYVNGTLFVADSNRVGAGPINNRVLIFKDIGSQLPAPTAEIEQNGKRCPACFGTANVVLGQTDFTKSDVNLTQTGLRLATGVASDGVRLAVADTDNNRILIWNTIPTSNNQPADVVVGQPNFTSNKVATTASSLRGPQGIWIQDGRLYVTDSQNDRILIWNSIPTQNGQAADVVLGQPNFTTGPPVDQLNTPKTPSPSNMLTPVSVTSDGKRLYVSDLGFNRVLIWNSIPTSNNQPADLAVGQPDMSSGTANNSTKVCPSNGVSTVDNTTPTYPVRCGATLSFPRYALSDGTRLFVSDGGNDRVLVYKNVPTSSGATADVVLGQPDATSNTAQDFFDDNRGASTDVIRTPMSLAWDGTNLFVADPFNRRVSVFSPADPNVPFNGVRNAASGDVFATGGVNFTGTIKEGDVITIKVNGDSGKTYTYTVVKEDTLTTVVDKIVGIINSGSGDPLVIAIPNRAVNTVLLTSRIAGQAGNDIPITATVSANAVIAATASNTSGGQDAARLAPGTLITILGENLSDGTAVAKMDGVSWLPWTLANTKVYVDGREAPLLFVSPTQINAQLPFEISDAVSTTLYVRSVRNDGRVTVTSPVAIPVISQNPGIFANPGTDPRVAIAYHASSNGFSVVSVDGTIKANDTATIKIEDRSYTYTVKAEDTLTTVRDALIGLINANADEKVTAGAATVFTRITLTAKTAGPGGNGIAISTSVSTGASIILSALNSATCCASNGGGLIDEDNPAVPGELITIYGTGLGLPLENVPRDYAQSGIPYAGPASNSPNEFVSALAGGKTAQVIGAALKPGTVGIYEIQLLLASDLPSNDLTQITIAQSFQISNIVTIPVAAP